MDHLSFYTTRFGIMVHYAEDQVVGRALDLYGQWAMDEIALIVEVMTRHQKGDFLDIGSNIGTHSLAVAKLLPGTRIFAYDAQAAATKLFSTNMCLNNVPSCEIRNVAVGSETCFKTFYVDQTRHASNMGAAQFKTDHTSGDEIVLLPQLALDDVHTRKVAFIKIDIEGSELDCLRGASKLLLRDRPVVYFENNGALGEGEIFDFLHSLDYRTFWHINEPFDPENFKQAQHSIYGGSGEVNVICIHAHSSALPFISERMVETKHPLVSSVWYKLRYLNKELKQKVGHHPPSASESFCVTLACLALNADHNRKLDEALETILEEDIPSFAALRSCPTFGVVENISRPLLSAVIRKRAFDEAAYLGLHEDVAQAVSQGVIASGKEHFATAGYFEGRAVA